MPIYPALMGRPQRPPMDISGPLRTGFMIGSQIAAGREKRKEKGELRDLRQAAIEEAMGQSVGGAQPGAPTPDTQQAPPAVPAPRGYPGARPRTGATGIQPGATDVLPRGQGPAAPQPAAAPQIGATPQAAYQYGEAMGRLWAADPDAAAQLQAQIKAMSGAQRARQKQNAEMGGRLALSVLGAPPDQRAAYYAKALEMAQAQGLDVSGLPPQWSPEAEQQLRIQVGMSQAVKEMIDNEQSRVTTMTPTEAGAVGYRPGTVVQKAGTGAHKVTQKPLGEGKTGQDPARVRESQWLVKNKVFPDLKSAYAATRTRVAMDPQAVRVKGLAWVADQEDRYGRPKYSTPEAQAAALSAYQLFAGGKPEEAVAELKKLEPDKKVDKPGLVKRMWDSLTGGPETPAPQGKQLAAKAGSMKGPDGNDYPVVSDQAAYDKIPSGGTYYHAGKKQFLKKK